jgi:ketosteroid isomerase-like protein
MTMTDIDNANTMLAIFAAIERRDAQRLRDLFDPEADFHWPPSLPYHHPDPAGARTGSPAGPGTRPTWEQTWDPLQPTEAERRMDPRVVAAAGEEVVVLWRQRGISPDGERFDGPVLGLYRLRAGRLVRAQMFYFDTAALVGFLARDGRLPTLS